MGGEREQCAGYVTGSCAWTGLLLAKFLTVRRVDLTLVLTGTFARILFGHVGKPTEKPHVAKAPNFRAVIWR